MRWCVPGAFKLMSQTGQDIALEGPNRERLVVSVLEEDLVRVRFWPDVQPRLGRTWSIPDAKGDVPPSGRKREDMSRFSRPTFGQEQQRNGLSIQTQKMRLEIQLSPLQLRWYLPEQSTPFAADLAERAYAYDRLSSCVIHTMQRDAEERYYGFGEKTGMLNKHGRRMRMLNLDAARYNAETSDPLYKHYALYTTFLPQAQLAYGLFYDNLSIATFDMGQEHHNFWPAYRYAHFEDGDIDYYMMLGPDISGVTEKIANLTGHMVLPPRWSLGYLGSTMTYTDAPDAQAQLRNFAELCDTHDIPCDMFHLSSGYTSGHDGKRYVFHWNRDKIPDPQAMVDGFHDAHIHLAANVKPCFLATHPQFEEIDALSGFVRAAESDEPQFDAFWGGQGAHLDFTQSAAFQWWQDQLKTHLLRFGIDAIWNDNNEFAIWDDDARYEGAGEPVSASLAGRPLQTLLMAQASFAALQSFRPDLRPFVITRAGCPGIQRFAQSWTGDNQSNWHTLQFNIPMGLGLGLSGMPNIGHDVGGFFGALPSPELFVRWVQNGIFHPRFTIHSWHDDGSVNEPWMYPEVLPIIRETIQFRYRLLPYLYSLFFEASRTGHPIIRPLVYHFSEDPMTWDSSFDFLLGPWLLVASVWTPEQRQREVYLPEHTAWCDWHTGTWYEGGQTVALAAPLKHIPLLVRSGGLVPTGHAMRHMGAQPDDLRRIYAFPAPASEGGFSEFDLYEDDGRSVAYKEGAYTLLRLKMESTSTQIQLHVEAIHRGYPLPYSTLEFVFPAGETRPIVGADAVSQDDTGRLVALWKL